VFAQYCIQFLFQFGGSIVRCRLGGKFISWFNAAAANPVHINRHSDETNTVLSK
jgi:hypothetical protein